MHGNHPLNVFGREPASLARPILPKLEFRLFEAVLGWTDAQKATWAVERDLGNLAGAETAYASACKALGQANASRVMRRLRVANAFRAINARRAALRRARQSLVTSQAALAAMHPIVTPPAHHAA